MNAISKLRLPPARSVQVYVILQYTVSQISSSMAHTVCFLYAPHGSQVPWRNIASAKINIHTYMHTLFKNKGNQQVSACHSMSYDSATGV